LSRVKYNQGVEGNVVNFGAMSIGTGSQAQQTAPPTDAANAQQMAQLQQQVELLRQAISAHAASLGNVEHLLHQTSLVGEELKKESPNKGGIMHTLESLAGGLTSISGLAKAALALKTAVVAFL
jgi:hypothetical protein